MWDKDGAPADGCRVTVKVTSATGGTTGLDGTGPGLPGSASGAVIREIELPAVRESSTGSQGGRGSLYQVLLPPMPPGTFQLSLSANKAGNLLGANQRQVEIGVPGAESVTRSANPDLMRALADARPGLAEPGSLPLADFPQLVDQLVAPYQRRPSAEPQRLWPLYDDSFHALAMLAFMALLKRRMAAAEALAVAVISAKCQTFGIWHSAFGISGWVQKKGAWCLMR